MTDRDDFDITVCFRVRGGKWFYEIVEDGQNTGESEMGTLPQQLRAVGYVFQHMAEEMENE
jgi:hypothetical protein